MKSTISVEGQATIPKAIRDHLNVGPGDQIKFFVHPDDSVVILPKIPVSNLKGIVRARRRVSLDEMDAAISQGATAALSRSRRRLTSWNAGRQRRAPASLA